MSKHIVFVSIKENYQKNDDFIKTKLLKKFNSIIYEHLFEENVQAFEANLVVLFGEDLLWKRFPEKKFGSFFRDEDGQMITSIQNYKDYDQLEKKELLIRIKEIRDKLNKYFSRFALVRVTDTSYFYRDINFRKIKDVNPFKANYKFVEDEYGEFLSYDGKKLKKVSKDFRTFSPTYEEHLRSKDLFYYENYPNLAHTRILHYFTFDIETNQSIDIIDTPEPIVSIVAYSNIHDRTFVWLLKKRPTQFYDETQFKKEKIIVFDDERKMLTHFLSVLTKLEVDLIAGWNCIPLEQSVWCKDKILPIRFAEKELYSSKIIISSKISEKEKWEISLANGFKFYTSGEHRIPLISVPKNKYTNLKNKIVRFSEFQTQEIEKEKSHIFYVEIPLRKNLNEDYNSFTMEQLYLAGLVYTDGSIKNRKKRSSGFNISQSDKKFLFSLPLIQTRVTGPYRNNFRRNVKKSLLDKAIDLIYNDQNKKQLNKEELSKLSYKQFMSFLSGMLDGDGCNTRNTGMSLCGTPHTITIMYELCLWNGIFSTIGYRYTNEENLRFLNINLQDLTLRKQKRWNKLKLSKLLRNSKQKSQLIKVKFFEDKCFVRVKSVRNTKEKVSMMDIETDTHYYYTAGVKTHNSDFFDVPYLLHRCKKLGVDFSGFLPDVYETIGKDGEKSYYCHDVILWDYLRYAKWIMIENKPLSWSLDAVSQHLLNEKKIEHNGVDLLWDDNNLTSLLKYNIRDVYLTEKIAQKQKLVEFPILYQRITPQTYESVYFNSRFLENLIHQRFKQFKFPSKKKVEFDSKFEGALVLETKPGIYENVSVYDFSSLYPSIMISLNLSKDTIIEHLKDFDHNKDIKIDEIRFSADKKGLIPQLSQLLVDERKKIKTRKDQYTGDSQEFKILNDMEMCFKATSNALYGVMGYPGFILYDQRVASSVTFVGREVLRYIKKLAQEEGYQILFADTDAVAVEIKADNFDKSIEKSKELEKLFNKSIPDFLRKFTKNEMIIKSHTMNIVFDKSFSKLLLSPAKKKQVGFVKYYKGKILEKEELNIKGFEAIKDDTPVYFKKVLTRLYENILNYWGNVDKLREFVNEVKIDLRKQSIVDLVIRKKMSKRMEEYDSRVQHVQAIKNSNVVLKRGETVNMIFVKDKREVIHYDPRLNLTFEVNYKKYYTDFIVKKIELIDANLHYHLFLEKIQLVNKSKLAIEKRIKRKSAKTTKLS